MKFRIKQKILLLLIALLSVTITSLALLAAYSTGRQNESAAFADLDRHLRTWQNDLESSVVHLRDVAIREVSDPASMTLLSQLLGLQLTIDDSHQSAANAELSRTLGYEKSVALGRMLPVLHRRVRQHRRVPTRSSESARVLLGGWDDGCPRWPSRRGVDFCYPGYPSRPAAAELARLAARRTPVGHSAHGAQSKATHRLLQLSDTRRHRY